MGITEEIRSSGKVDASQLVKLFDEVSNNGHVFIVKSDGPREKTGYTCIISLPDEPMNSIRRDGEDLLETVYQVVCEYKF